MCQSNFYDYMGKRKQFIHFGVFLQMGYTRYYAELDGNEIMKYICIYILLYTILLEGVVGRKPLTFQNLCYIYITYYYDLGVCLWSVIDN